MNKKLRGSIPTTLKINFFKRTCRSKHLLAVSALRQNMENCFGKLRIEAKSWIVKVKQLWAKIELEWGIPCELQVLLE